MITLTREHNDWVKSVFGVDPSAYEKVSAAPPSGARPPGDGGPPLVNGAASAGVPVAGPAVAGPGAPWANAVASGDWAAAAMAGLELGAADLQKEVAQLSDPAVMALYRAAVALGGPKSPVAAVTREAAYGIATAAGDWPAVAECLNGFSASEMKARISKLSGEALDAVHNGAVASRALGASSNVALATEVLAHPVLGPDQSARAEALREKLSPEDQKKYQTLLDGAKSAKEKQFITKGLAANHSVAELEEFGKKIAGKDEKWLQDNLSLTGASDGSGVKQQWHDSCGPTTFEAVQGELDPLYALDKHEKNPNLNQADDTDATKKNSDLAEDQRKVLVAGGGVAVNRNQRGGSGRWIADALNNVKASTGLEYKLNLIGQGATVEDGITAINDATSKGEPVPISIGNKTRVLTQHYVLVTASDPGPPRYYTIHDPWSGETVIRSEDQVRNGKLDIAGCNELGSFDKPTPVEVK